MVITAIGGVVWLGSFFAGLSGYAALATKWSTIGIKAMKIGMSLFTFPPLAIGVGTVILLAIAWRYWKKRKKKTGEISDLKLGEVLKIYIL